MEVQEEQSTHTRLLVQAVGALLEEGEGIFIVDGADTNTSYIVWRGEGFIHIDEADDLEAYEDAGMTVPLDEELQHGRKFWMHTTKLLN